MSLSRRTFYRARCDGLGDGRACDAVLTDGEHSWWDEESIAAWLGEAEWIEWTEDSGVQHYCFDHWTTCEECGEKVPVRYAGIEDDLTYCPPCGMKIVEAKVRG